MTVKKALLALTISCFFLASLVLAPQAAAQTQPWSGSCVADGDVATIQGFQCLLGNLLSIAITGIGLVGFVMMIMGAFRYLLSGGNAKGAESARGTITFAIVGLVVALSAFIILNLIQRFLGIENNILTRFVIPDSSTGL